jgi:hypothetical protein
MSVRRFKLENSDVGKCYNFAFMVTKKTKSYYEKRNKYASTEKMIFDHSIGKMAEIVVHDYLVADGKECSYPSFKVNSYGDSGDIKAYLVDRTVVVHCKCVRHDSPITDSWLIEEKEIEQLGEDDYFALCKFYEPNEIEVCLIVPATQITWRDPISPFLKSKKACYLSDLIDA